MRIIQVFLFILILCLQYFSQTCHPINLNKRIEFNNFIVYSKLDTITNENSINNKYLTLNIFTKTPLNLIQVIENSKELYNDPYFYFAKDINYDGFTDIVIEYRDEIKIENHVDVWLYDPVVKKFIFSNEFSKLNQITIHESKPQISSIIIGEPIIKTTYSILENSALQKIKVEYFTYIKKDELDNPSFSDFKHNYHHSKQSYYLYTCDSLINNEWKTIKKEVIDNIVQSYDR